MSTLKGVEGLGVSNTHTKGKGNQETDRIDILLGYSLRVILRKKGEEETTDVHCCMKWDTVTESNYRSLYQYKVVFVKSCITGETL